MRALDANKLKRVANYITSILREHLEWRDGAQVASVDDLPAGSSTAKARLALKGEHLNDILGGDGFERLGKRIAFKLLPSLRNGLSEDSKNTPSDQMLEAPWRGGQAESIQVIDGPFTLRLLAWEHRWADDSGYLMGDGLLEAQLSVERNGETK